MRVLASKHQTVENYHIPMIEIEHDQFEVCYLPQAYCERISGGEIAVAKLKRGCLWTMLPP